MTVPSPIVLHFLGGNDAILREAYSSLDQFWSDVIEVYRNELAALHDAGCTYLQVDETSLVKFGDPEIRAIVEEPRRRLAQARGNLRRRDQCGPRQRAARHDRRNSCLPRQSPRLLAGGCRL